MALSRSELQALADAAAMVTSGEARELRVGAGITLQQVAETLSPSLSVAAVSHWETGYRRPRGPNALLYAFFLRDLRRAVARATQPGEVPVLGTDPPLSDWTPRSNR